MAHLIQVRHLLAGATLALVASACVKDNTGPGGTGVVRDVAFIGYSTPETQQTTCGNCHVLKQASWAKTGHANAWKDLQASGHASESCYKCHTTNGATNIGADTAGYFAASESAKKYYQDVQCEACHGPGAAHVTTPDETQPIPYFASYDTTNGVGCGQCHSGPPHNPFYEDWSRGAHGILEAPAISNTSGTCRQCHEAKVAMQRFGGSNVFVENSDTKAYPIGCTTCHNPHGSENTHELRESITARDTTNLCIQCHKRNSVPDTANTRGPHSPQGTTFLGISGWRPAGFADTASMTTHSNPTANPKLCATCHVATLDVNDAAGKLAWHYTGHSFFAIPCVDTAGIDSTNSCASSQRSFAACTASGCHADEATVRSLFTSLDAETKYLAGVLWTDVNGDGKINTGDTGLLTQVASSEFKRDAVITVAEGALFNVQLITSDRSHGVHNPSYLKNLLIATINAVKAQYGLAVSAPAQQHLDQAAARVAAR